MPYAAPPRDFPPLAQRVLIIGLDGATFDVLDPVMAAGLMPRLKAAIDSGARGLLRSTIPPLTPAAWTTFQTGQQPGRHGIIDFEQYDNRTGHMQFNSTRSLDHIRNIWQILTDRGLRVGCVNIPMTYPVIPVNGFMVSGFETPNTDSDFVYPPELKGEILARWPDPTVTISWKRKALGGIELFQKNLDYISNSFHQGAAMSAWLGEKYGWDVLMVVLKMVDNLQHKTWKYLDPRWPNRDRPRRERAKQCFVELDKAIGKLLDYATSKGASVMMVSDHGHGSLEGQVQPNLLLQRWGYLALKGGGSQGATRGKYLLERMFGKRRSWKHTLDIEADLAVDHARTRACVMHAGNAAFVYINLKGRQPTGIVDLCDYEPLRAALSERFQSPECRIRNPEGKTIELFPGVYKPEEVYGCTRDEQPWLPDLLLIPHDTLAVVRKIRGRSVVRWSPYRRLEGTHRHDGIFIATGPGIAPQRTLKAGIIDCAPTLMAMLGLRIPAEMTGRVITDAFDRTPVVEKQVSAATIAAAHSRAPSTAESEVYSERELQQVTERLSDLGYLE
ncbi:MAG TPA: alkaline phosphatase family protein [Phycisphaerae bacterium]